MMREISGYAEGAGFDLILADPPFTQKMAHDVMLAASQSAAFGPHTKMTIESEKRERMDEKYESLTRIDMKSFGDKFLSFFTKSEDIES